MDTVRTSKFLSLVLRHKPEAAGLSLDEAGWCPVSELLSGCAKHSHSISLEELNTVVADNDKKRFQFSEDGKRIRAVQGHSVEVSLGYVAAQPPDFLFHGTATRFLDSIKRLGLVKGSRQHVHLSATETVAFTVGARHGKAVVIPVYAGYMWSDHIDFFLAPNGVWLVDSVPVQYLQLDDLRYMKNGE